MTKDSAIQDQREKIDQLNKEAWEVRVNDSPKAFTLSQESLKLARTINYEKGIAEGARSLGFCYVRLSKNDEAMPLLSEALALFQSLGDLNGQAVVNEYMAVVRRNRGDFAAALDLFFEAVAWSKRTGSSENLAIHLYQLGVTYKYLGNFEKALDYLFQSISIHKENKNRLYESYPLNVIGSIYFENNDYVRALEYFKEGLMIRQEFQDKLGEAGSLDNLASTYFKLKDYAEAIDYCTQSLAISKNTGDKRSEASALQHLAEIYEKTGEAAKAAKFCNESLEIRKSGGDKKGEAEILLFLARINKNEKEGDQKVIEWLNEALKISEEIKAMPLVSQTRLTLYEYHKQRNNFKEAIDQLELHLQLENDLQKNAINQKVVNLEISYKAEQAKKEAEVVQSKNEELTKLNSEIQEQKKALEKTLTDLRATQAQLIQSEKMASLGELTAGIAHEIQNPLNFVNNFSEVNAELIDELKSELAIGNMQSANEIADTIKENEEKINQHGKRADGIVKGMLQHSRSSSGQKEPTDINILVDEYLRLAYHGLRAKDKSFNAKFQTDFDQTLGKINLIQQDIGRVILNLISNAFYAVDEKQKKKKAGYDPTVIVKTKKAGSHILVTVTDNGNGIPQKILDKIFQPFFTTKPTGQGTGLGLSLSYDIVTKGHGGELKVETHEGEGSTFIIQLPIQQNQLSYEVVKAPQQAPLMGYNTMKAKSIKGNSSEEIKSALKEATADASLPDGPGYRPTLALVFISIKQDREAICEILNNEGIDIIGATSSGEFINGYQSGGETVIMLFDIKKTDYCILFEDIGDRPLQDAAANMSNAALQKFNKPAFILLSTGFTYKGEFLKGESLLRSIEKVVGPEINIFGGMAGDDITFTGSCVFTNERATDYGMAALILNEEKIGLEGMAISGWKPMGVFRTVTKSEENLIFTIDDQPALEIYLRLLGKEITSSDDQVDFFDAIGIYYPFQIEREGREPLLCNPIGYSREKEALVCESNVPQGSRFRFSTPPDFDIIETVVGKAQELKDKTQTEADALLIFSCAGRLNALGPMAQEENEGLYNVWKAPMAGFYTYGEFGRAINGKHEFHSTTCCWVALKEK